MSCELKALFHQATKMSDAMACQNFQDFGFFDLRLRLLQVTKMNDAMAIPIAQHHCFLAAEQWMSLLVVPAARVSGSLSENLTVAVQWMSLPVVPAARASGSLPENLLPLMVVAVAQPAGAMV